MRSIPAIAAIVSLALPLAAQAAPDPRFMDPADNFGRPRIDAGVLAAVSLPLGAKSSETGPRLTLRAGPGMTGRDPHTRSVRTRVAPLAEFSLRPGHSSTWSLAGTPVARTHTLAGLREEQASQAKKEGQKGVSTLGAIGIGAGVLLVAAGVGLLLFIDAVEDNSD